MEIKALVSQMTLEEKAGLCSGLDFWHTKSVERLGVPSVMVSDGPHGLRKQDDKGDHLGMNDSIKAVCMPAASATAASFDRDLIRKMGEAIGDSCQHEKLSVVLGPAVNIKRSPLCGRNFEYFSEDPYLAGEMSAAYINGVQSRNVGTSIKHFAANNQEHRRMSSSSNADERTLREIYFPAFETSVKKAQPWTVMCSYNRINGVYASENPWLLTDVLRKEWGFEGYVMSDWGAVSNRVAGVAAGLDLEMPSSGGINDARIVEAVRSGKLDEKLVDQAVERILTINFRYLENAKPETPWDMEAQHLLSADIAADCMVLLKNEGILPLSQDEEAAFIGEFAAQLDDDLLRRLETQPLDVLQQHGVARGDDPLQFARRVGREDHAGRIAAHARNADQQPEQFPLDLRRKPVEQLGVLADDVVHVKSGLGGVLDGGIGFERNMEVVAHPAGVDNGVSRSDFGDGSLDVFVHESQNLMQVGQK